jgi:hypothetical protein
VEQSRRYLKKGTPSTVAYAAAYADAYRTFLLDVQRHLFVRSILNSRVRRPTNCIRADEDMRLKGWAGEPGLSALADTWDYRSRADPSASKLSDYAEGLGKPTCFTTAIRETCANAQEMAKVYAGQQLLDNFDWNAPTLPNLASTNLTTDPFWTENVNNVRRAVENTATTSLTRNILLYQQKYHIDKRVTALYDQALINKPSSNRSKDTIANKFRIEVLKFVVTEFSLTTGHSDSAGSKARTYLKSLFDVREDYITFLLTHSGWARLLLNQAAGTAKLCKGWIDVIAPALNIVWRVEELLHARPNHWQEKLALWLCERGQQAGAKFSKSQRETYTYDRNEWSDLEIALSWRAQFRPAHLLPGAKTPGLLSFTSGPMASRGTWLNCGYGGDSSSHKSSFVTLVRTHDVMTLVSYGGSGDRRLSWPSRRTQQVRL